MGVSAKEAKEQMAGVYNIPLAHMPAAFEKSASTKCYYASGEIIGGLLKTKGQIGEVPPAEAAGLSLEAAVAADAGMQSPCSTWRYH